MVYIDEVRAVMKRIDGDDYFVKKLSKKENDGFKGYEILIYKPNSMYGKGIINDLTKLGLIFVSKRTNSRPYCERYLFNF